MPFKLIKQAPEGLSGAEAAVQLDAGEIVAAAVTTRWLGNNGGVLFAASARWIDAAGATHRCPNGQEIRTDVTHSADPHMVDEFGVDAIAKEMLLAVLGQKPTEVTRIGEAGPFQAPMLAHSPEWRLNASIRHAIDTAVATAPVHAGKLLQS